MTYIGEAMKDILIQEAYANLKKRGYKYVEKINIK